MALDFYHRRSVFKYQFIVVMLLRLITGIATVLLAALITFILPANIATAKFLTEEEREFARKLLTFD